MRRFLFWLLSPSFGKKGFSRFYQVLMNVSLQGLNYRNTHFKKNGELFFIRKVKEHFTGKNEKPVLFDVGANVGNYSQALYDVFGSNSSIYAFEPFSAPFQSLAALKEKIPNLKVFNIGLSDEPRKLTIHSNKAFSEVGGLYDRDLSLYDFKLQDAEDCNFETLDDFTAKHGIEKIHLLKVDVEGHDYFVLKGAEKMIHDQRIDFIQFEYGSVNYLSKTYLYDFFKLLAPNYKIYKLLSNGLKEIEAYNTDIEIHVLSNYIASSRKINF